MQPRVERDALGRCEYSRDHHRHVWMKYATQPAGVNVFCSRCGVQGVFSQLELEQWRKTVERYWQRRGIS